MEQTAERKYDLRYLTKIAWPVFIEYGLSATVGLADTVMVSNLGSTSISAVGLVDSINQLFQSIYNAIASGTTVVVSQSTGSGDKKTVYRSVGQSTLFGLLLMTFVGLGLFLFRGLLFGALYPDVEADLRANALSYMAVTAFSYPLVAVFANLAGALRGIGDTKAVMVASMVINAVNIGLNYLLIYVAGLGVAGAALATCIGRLFGCVMLLIHAGKVWGRSVFSVANMKFTSEIIRRLMNIGVPAGVDTALFQAGKIIVSVFVGKMSTALISANTIAMSCFGIMCIPGNALQVTGVTITGQCWGAKRKDLARKNLLKCIFFSVAMLVVISAALWFPAEAVMRIYKPEPDALPEAVKLFRILLIIIPLFWPTAFCSSGGLRAADDVRFVTVVSVCSMWVFRVGFAWILGLRLGWGPSGVCIAMGLDWVCRTAFYMTRILFGPMSKRRNNNENIEFLNNMPD